MNATEFLDGWASLSKREKLERVARYYETRDQPTDARHSGNLCFLVISYCKRHDHREARKWFRKLQVKNTWHSNRWVKFILRCPTRKFILEDSNDYHN